MEYCKRCLYPANAKPTIIFDDEGICSGCRYHENRAKLEIDWDEREQIFEQIIDEAKKLKKIRGNSHDCIIPVSGGKDSRTLGSPGQQGSSSGRQGRVLML